VVLSRILRRLLYSQGYCARSRRSSRARSRRSSRQRRGVAVHVNGACDRCEGLNPPPGKSRRAWWHGCDEWARVHRSSQSSSDRVAASSLTSTFRAPRPARVMSQGALTTSPFSSLFLALFGTVPKTQINPQHELTPKLCETQLQQSNASLGVLGCLTSCSAISPHDLHLGRALGYLKRSPAA
jgi:hypothetical protein